MESLRSTSCTPVNACFRCWAVGGAGFVNGSVGMGGLLAGAGGVAVLVDPACFVFLIVGSLRLFATDGSMTSFGWEEVDSRAVAEPVAVKAGAGSSFTNKSDACV